ncbi:protein obstructor-E-like [Leguminivora glycinivorella]|uniref:protein obstructor-E-like n=1 Tax=Leguminivora glycinivorella TaxID=1035111 RepID=UPI00200E8EC0|nr:protein obstructor-E-like [Leguminivora glycinivorella]
MKTLVCFLSACAFAQAQFGSFNSGRSSNAFGNTRSQAQPSAFGSSGNTRQTQASAFSSFGGQSQSAFGRQSAFQQTTASPRSSQYQQQPTRSAGSCRELNERSPVSGSCDRYIECINGTAEEKTCPDGLLFNANALFTAYPCQYPNEVQCLERSALQPAQPTEDCPHQFGYFKLGDARNCSAFRNCVNGVGYDFTCPEGLAFSSESYRCEWPDEVADCDAEAFLGFRCPEVPISKELGPPAGYRYYRSDVNCQKYFICIEGRPRVLSCGGDSAFDDLTSTCVSADEVAACPQDLRAAAARSREEEKQRLAKEISFNARPVQHKRRF